MIVGAQAKQVELIFVCKRGRQLSAGALLKVMRCVKDHRCLLKQGHGGMLLGRYVTRFTFSHGLLSLKLEEVSKFDITSKVWARRVRILDLALCHYLHLILFILAWVWLYTHYDITHFFSTNPILNGKDISGYSIQIITGFEVNKMLIPDQLGAIVTQKQLFDIVA